MVCFTFAYGLKTYGVWEDLPVTLGGGKIFTMAISSSSSIGTEKLSGHNSVGGNTSKSEKPAKKILLQIANVCSVIPVFRSDSQITDAFRLLISI